MRRRPFLNVALVFMLTVAFATRELNATWMMTNPTKGTAYTTTASISAGGNTDIGANINFTLNVWDNYNAVGAIVMNSSSGTTGTFSFGGTVAAPSGGWTLSATPSLTAIEAVAATVPAVKDWAWIKIQ